MWPYTHLESWSKSQSLGGERILEFLVNPFHAVDKKNHFGPQNYLVYKNEQV